MHLNHPTLVMTVEEGDVLHETDDFCGMLRVAGNNQQKWLDGAHSILLGVYLKLNLGGFMDADTIFKLQSLQRGRLHGGGIEILASGNSRLFDIAIFHSPRERIGEDDIFESANRVSSLHLRCGGELKAHHGLQRIDRVHGSGSPVTMSFIHDHDEIIQPREIFEVRLTKIFRKTPGLAIVL